MSLTATRIFEITLISPGNLMFDRMDVPVSDLKRAARERTGRAGHHIG